MKPNRNDGLAPQMKKPSGVATAWGKWKYRVWKPSKTIPFHFTLFYIYSFDYQSFSKF